MNYSIYLTNDCNLDCKYCYEKGMHNKEEISIDTIKNVIDYELKNKRVESVITFFGGEPLLKKTILYETAKYIEQRNAKAFFRFNLTTNGTLIDDEFVKFVANNDFISLSLSIDGSGKTHNLNRTFKNGLNTYEHVAKNAKKLIEVCDNIVAVPVISKNNVNNMFDSIENLLSIGFKKINFQFDLCAKWCDEDLSIIKKELDKISNLYMEAMRTEKEFHILSFDEKIRSYIDESFDCNENCSVGIRGVNVGTDGIFYPCMQFMYQPEYEIGNCKDGINKERQIAINKSLKREMAVCEKCLVRRRCNHTCACINKAYTGNAIQTSAFTCEIERLLISIADDIAEKMFAEKTPVFIQKYYNNYYSKIESQIKMKRGGKVWN